MSTSPTSASVMTGDTRPFAWFRSLRPEDRRAFVGAFGGFALDSYDFQMLPLGLVAIVASLGISPGDAGLLTTVPLVLSGVGGFITTGLIQSSWAVGWGLSVVVSTAVFSLVGPQIGWRVLFWTGALPALLVLYLRRRVIDAPIATEQTGREDHRGSFGPIFTGSLGRTTFFATLLATGIQGGYYTLATWLPAYLKTERHLTVMGTGSYLVLVISGAFLGYVTGSYLTDLHGRKRTFALLGGAMVFGAAGYGLGVLALLGLPETRGRELT